MGRNDLHRQGVALRRGRERALACAAAALFLAFPFAGCSVDQHHALLSIFFDGVPDPGAKGEKGEVSSQYFDDSGGLRVSKVDMVMHEPFKLSQCTRCHPKERSLALEMETEKNLCFNCHEHDAIKERIGGFPFVHGPVAVHGCIACHDPHESLNERLLSEKVPKLCYLCHDRKPVLSNPVHRDLDEEKCLGCHDPHGGKDRYFLEDNPRKKA